MTVPELGNILSTLNLLLNDCLVGTVDVGETRVLEKLVLAVMAWGYSSVLFAPSLKSLTQTYSCLFGSEPP